MKNITQFRIYIQGATAILEEELNSKKIEMFKKDSEPDEGFAEFCVGLEKSIVDLKKYLDYNF